MYRKGQRVSVTVERIFPFGVFVHLENGTRAYIRRRELTLSGADDPRKAVVEGQQLQARVSALADSERMMEVSVREDLPDPWQIFGIRARVGDVVQAEVKDLAPNRIFVEVLPGVDGVITLDDAVPWEVQRPDDVFWIGDQVEATITYLNIEGKRLRLSIRRRMEQLTQAEDIAAKLYRSSEPESEITTLDQDIDQYTADAQPIPGSITLAEPILVVEDHRDVRDPLVRWLEDLGCEVHGVELASKALSICEQHRHALVMVDLDMPEMNGLSFVQRLRKKGCDVPIAVMSGPVLIAEHLSVLESLNVAAVFPKPLDMDEVYQFLQLLVSGERPTLNVDVEDEKDSAIVSTFQRLDRVMRSDRSLRERMEEGLIELLEGTRAEKGIVFRLDPAAGKVSIVAQMGDLEITTRAIYALVDSPVKDVIVEDRPVWENRCSTKADRFRKLLNLLPFESCMGVPLPAAGQTEHALFLFHRKADAFSPYRLRDTQAMGTLFSATLEHQILDERVSALSSTLLAGHLAAAFSHEVYNKVSGLDLQFRNLRSDFERLATTHVDLGNNQDFQQVGSALESAVETALTLQQTVKSFRRLMQMKEKLQAVEVNGILQQAAASEIKTLARHAEVEIRLKLTDDPLMTIGNQVCLYQVFLNLMMNAIQHMELQGKGKRVLTILTLKQAGERGEIIEIRVEDTGPGIHKKLWERIFSLGFTTRPGGSGLGLYIARNLIEAMGGQIIVEESLIPIGTTILVTLPASGHDQKESVRADD